MGLLRIPCAAAARACIHASNPCLPACLPPAVDERLQPLTAALLLPTPVVVKLMQPALRALNGCLLAAIYTSARVDWGVSSAGGKKQKKAAPALQAAATIAGGAYVRTWALDARVHGKFQAVLDAYGELVEACAGEWVGATRCRHAVQH